MVEQNRGLSLITGGKCEGSVKRQIRFIPGRLEVIAGAGKSTTGRKNSTV